MTAKDLLNQGVDLARRCDCTGAIALFILIHLRRGYRLPTLLRFCWHGAKQSWPVFSILLLIGALMSTWLAGGTVPSLVYYGTQLIAPHYFVLSAFILI